MTDKTIVVVDGREPVIKSWARDVVTFGSLIGTAYILNVFMPPSGWLNAALSVCWFLWILGRSLTHRQRYTVSEAIAALEAMRELEKEAGR